MESLGKGEPYFSEMRKLRVIYENGSHARHCSERINMHSFI